MKKARRIISFIISLIMIFNIMTVISFAQDRVNTTNDEEVIESGEITKHLSSGENFLYNVYSDGLHIYDYVGSDTDVVVPVEIDDKIVRQIEPGTFKGDQYTSISIPSNLYFFGHNAIYNCPNLKTISVYGESGGYYVENGALMYNGVHTNNYTRLCYVPDAYEGTFVIPEGTYDIGRDAFDNCVAIEILVVPKSLQSIWDNYYVSKDFDNCVSLEKVYGSTSVAQLIANELELQYFQFDDESNFVYDEDENTHEIIIVSYIGQNSHVIIPNCINGKKVVEVRSHAISGQQIVQLTLFSNIENYNWNFISDCPNLQYITTYGNGGYYESNNMLLYKGPLTRNTLVVVKVPMAMKGDIVVPNGVYGIQANAFDDCKYVESIVFPESIHYYLDSSSQGDPEAIFVGLDNLKRVYGYDSTIASSLANANNVEYISLNENVYFKTEAINETTLALKDVSTKLVNIVIPNTWNGKTITTIKLNAFSWKNYSSLYIPNTITNIENGAFRACDNLTNIILEADNQNYIKIGKAIYSKNMKNLVFVERDYSGEFVIPNGVEVLYVSCMHYCRAITNVVIPNTVLEIGTFAFRNTRFTSIIIPESVTKIKGFAFYENTNLNSVTLPKTSIYLDRGVFEQCNSLTTITIPKKTTLGANVFKNNGLTEVRGYKGTMTESYAKELGITFVEILDFEYEKTRYNNVDGIKITNYIGDDTHIVIPNYIENLPVVEIQDRAISSDNVVSITLPTTMMFLGYRGIDNCPNLKTIILETPTYGYFVENNMIIYATPSEGLQHANPGVVRLCYVPLGLEGNVVIPKCINELEDDCFIGCDGITSLTMYENILGTTHGGNGLFALPNLTTIYGYIGTYAEEATNSVENLTFVPIDATVEDTKTKTMVTGKFNPNVKLTVEKEEVTDSVFAVEGYTCIEKVDISLTQNDNPATFAGNLTIKLKVQDYTKLYKVYQYTNNTFVSVDCSKENDYISVTTDKLDTLYIYEDGYLPKIVVDKSTVTRIQNTVDVKVTFTNCPGITTAKLNIEYGPHLKLEKITFNTDVIGGSTMTSKELSSPVALNWLNANADIKGTFVFATLTFSLQDLTDEEIEDDIKVTFDKVNIVNVNEDLVKMGVANGSVKILPYLPGDINGDNSVDNRDLVRLFKYLSQIQVEVNEHALDTNGDGVVNNKDLTRLFQYLSDWKVELY